MQNFQYYNPTRIFFGREALNELGTEAAKLGTRALLVYGKDSIRRSGLYDRVRELLEARGISVTDHSGVQPNPVLSHAREGVRLAREARADLIVAVGGGSVIDESKAVAAGALYRGDLWDLYSRKAAAESALPVLAVQTLPATSSENNPAAVLTNRETNEKFGLRSVHIQPRAAFLDPTLTLTIPVLYTAYAAFDIMSHLLEGYFTSADPFAPVQDGFVEGMVRAVMESLDRIRKNPSDWDARAALMWAGALGWNGLSNSGVIGARIPNHMLEHPLSAVYDIPHGAGLAVVFPAWLTFRQKELAPRILRFGRRILDMGEEVRNLPEEKACDRIIERFRDWIRESGCPRSLAEAGIRNPDITELVRQARTLCEYWSIPGYSDADLAAIYRSVLE